MSVEHKLEAAHDGSCYLLENKSRMQTQVTYRIQWGLIGRAWTTRRRLLVVPGINARKCTRRGRTRSPSLNSAEL